MQITRTDLDALNSTITIALDQNDFAEKVLKVLNDYRKNANIPGFRKGNVPNDVLKQRYGDSIHYEVLNELIQESYPKELQEQNIKPASSPAISI